MLDTEFEKEAHQDLPEDEQALLDAASGTQVIGLACLVACILISLYAWLWEPRERLMSTWGSAVEVVAAVLDGVVDVMTVKPTASSRPVIAPGDVDAQRDWLANGDTSVDRKSLEKAKAWVQSSMR